MGLTVRNTPETRSEAGTKEKGRQILGKVRDFLKPPSTFSIYKKIVIITLLFLSVGLICFGAVYSSAYASKASSLWYRSLYGKVSSSTTGDLSKSSGKEVRSRQIDQNILIEMADPDTIPDRARTNQKKANITGGIGILGILLLAFIIIYCFYIKRKDSKAHETGDTM